METVAIIGSGIVGRSWAMLFASGGHTVRLFDVLPQALAAAPLEIQKGLIALEEKGQLKNSTKLSAAEQFKLISVFYNLEDALHGATYIQECTPETLEMKTATFKELNRVLVSIGNTTAIVGSSSSTIQASKFASGLDISKRCLVVHPVNPPYFVRLVELSPSSETNPSVTEKVRNMLTSLGHKPIVLKKEVEGFALNRVQYAILNEMWRLVSEGILSVEDADLVMKEGLAPRYIFMGPLETAQLNANGFIDYCQRYADCIFTVSQSQLDIPKMCPDSHVGKEIDAGLQKVVPDSELGSRREWRDKNLALLSLFKTNLGL